MKPDATKELRVSELAQVVLRRILETGGAGKNEVRFMHTAEYSKQFFNLQYPLLVAADSDFD